MRERYEPNPGGYRVEHRPPDGPPRLLAETTMPSMAQASASTWRRRLRQAGRRGTVAIVAAPTGESVWERRIDAEPAPDP